MNVANFLLPPSTEDLPASGNFRSGSFGRRNAWHVRAGTKLANRWDFSPGVAARGRSSPGKDGLCPSGLRISGVKYDMNVLRVKLHQMVFSIERGEITITPSREHYDLADIIM